MPRYSSKYNLAGRVFGRLTVLRRQEPYKKPFRWICLCECGVEKPVGRWELLSGDARSCGCLQLELAKQRATTHGEYGTAEYRAWRSMITRCENQNHDKYEYYGGRGIIVCPRWRGSFAAFLEDMGKKPSRRHTLDRKDPDGNYEPGNCRWATQKGQMRNTRRNVVLEIGGVSKTVAEWAEDRGISPFMIYKRLGRGWSPIDAISKPARTTRLTRCSTKNP